MNTTDTRSWTDGLPWTEAIGTATGLVIGFAIAFALVGPATATAFMTTIAVVLPMIVVGQRVAAKEFDIAFWMAVGLVALVVGSTALTYYTYCPCRKLRS